MPSARVKRMIAVGRKRLEGNPTMAVNDYSVLQRMALEVTDHSKQEQAEALDELRLEFKDRQKS